MEKQVIFECEECNKDKGRFDTRDNWESLNEAFAHMLKTGHTIKLNVDIPSYSLNSD